MIARTHWILVSTLAVAVMATPTAQEAAQEQQPPPAFRTGVDVVSLTITATDSDGRYVTALEQEDLAVYEDGVQQDIHVFTKTPLPIALALLMDSSASMEDRLKTVQQAAVGFARRLRPQDVAEVIGFASRVNIRQSFTNDRSMLETAITSTSASGSTSLHNAIYVSLKELKKVQARTPDEVRRQAIVVFSDGEDTSSLVSFDEVLDLTKRSETAIYAIGLRDRDPSSSVGFLEAEFVLQQLAQETGGRAFFVNDVEELPAIYNEISEELASQYTIGYTSKNPLRDGQWRRVVVRVNLPDVSARTKQGYYAPVSF